jgi:hypothetical protein
MAGSADGAFEPHILFNRRAVDMPHQKGSVLHIARVNYVVPEQMPHYPRFICVVLSRTFDS